MTATVATTARELIERAGLAAARSLPVGEPVTPTPTAAMPDLAGAVLIPFSGSVSGELAILVDAQIIATVPGAANDSQALVTALGQAIADIIGALGSVRAGIPQALDTRMAATRVSSYADSAIVTLAGAGGVRAAISVGVELSSSESGDQVATVSLDRLDLLRGVEMQASAELGRARMTINDLLSLRTGAVIELDRAAGDPADLFVNGRLLARGEVVVIDENYALRITQIVSDETGR